MKKYLRKTHIFLGGASLILAALIGSYIFAYLSFKNIMKDKSEITAELLEEKAKKEEQDSIKANLKSTIEENKRLTSIILSHEEAVDFIQNIEGLAKSSGLQIVIESVEAKPSEALSPFSKEYIVVSLNTAGLWADTVQFVSLLEKLPYKISLRSAEISAPALQGTQQRGENNAKTAEISADKSWRAKITFEAIKTFSKNDLQNQTSSSTEK